LWAWRLAGRDLMYVPHYSHDLSVSIATTRDRNATPDPVAIEESARQGLVDQYGVRRSRAIRRAERTPGDQRDSESLEVVRRNHIETGIVFGTSRQVLR